MIITAAAAAAETAAAAAAETAAATAAAAAIEAGENGSDIEISEFFYYDPNNNAIYANISDIPDGE